MRKVRHVLGGVGEWTGPGIVCDVSFVEARRRMVETNRAFEAKLRSPLGETGRRDVIAEAIPRPGQIARLRRDVETGFQHGLVAVVARTEHHAVLAERNRLAIVIGRDVPDRENRHCGPKLMLAIACTLRANAICRYFGYRCFEQENAG